MSGMGGVEGCITVLELFPSGSYSENGALIDKPRCLA